VVTATTTAATDDNKPPWSQIAFDLSEFAEYSASLRQDPKTADPEQVSWLAELLSERVRSDQGELPAFPGLAMRILKIMEAPDPDLKKLVQTIREDAMVSAQLLRMANSVYYSRGCEVTTVHDAAVRLGMRAVANVAIAAATRAMFDAHEREYRASFSAQWQRLSRYCVQCAAGARWLSLWIRKGDPEQAFLGGLLHDIGKVVALRAMGAMVHDGDISAQTPVLVVEAALEEVHVSLGSELALFWNLPGYVSYLCEEHHQARPASAPANNNMHLVRIASTLYESRTNPLYRSSLEDELFWSALSFGIAREPLHAVAEQLKKLGGASTSAM
jgi:HD-like signal output (HDOD) protein